MSSSNSSSPPPRKPGRRGFSTITQAGSPAPTFDDNLTFNRPSGPSTPDRSNSSRLGLGAVTSNSNSNSPTRSGHKLISRLCAASETCDMATRIYNIAKIDPQFTSEDESALAPVCASIASDATGTLEILWETVLFSSGQGETATEQLRYDVRMHLSQAGYRTVSFASLVGRYRVGNANAMTETMKLIEQDYKRALSLESHCPDLVTFAIFYWVCTLFKGDENKPWVSVDILVEDWSVREDLLNKIVDSLRKMYWNLVDAVSSASASNSDPVAPTKIEVHKYLGDLVNPTLPLAGRSPLSLGLPRTPSKVTTPFSTSQPTSSKRKRPTSNGDVDSQTSSSKKSTPSSSAHPDLNNVPIMPPLSQTIQTKSILPLPRSISAVSPTPTNPRVAALLKPSPPLRQPPSLNNGPIITPPPPPPSLPLPERREQPQVSPSVSPLTKSPKEQSRSPVPPGHHHKRQRTSEHIPIVPRENSHLSAPPPAQPRRRVEESPKRSPSQLMPPEGVAEPTTTTGTTTTTTTTNTAVAVAPTITTTGDVDMEDAGRQTQLLEDRIAIASQAVISHIEKHDCKNFDLKLAVSDLKTRTKALVTFKELSLTTTTAKSANGSSTSASPLPSTDLSSQINLLSDVVRQAEWEVIRRLPSLESLLMTPCVITTAPTILPAVDSPVAGSSVTRPVKIEDMKSDLELYFKILDLRTRLELRGK